MLRRLTIVLSLCLLAAGTQTATAFSLVGPPEAFQTTALGYGLAPAVSGSPKNLAEEYRWNIPVITYAFDESFLTYFGTVGVAEVEKAMAILNALPNVNSITTGAAGDPNLYNAGVPFPTSTKGVNFAAQGLGLLDMKSVVLESLLYEMGLDFAENWVWCLRDRVTLNNNTVTNYFVIKRNFDPVTFSPSSFVNGILYTYSIIDTVNPNVADAVEGPPVGGPGQGYTSVAGRNLGLGQFYSGLTRDDVGGLRYLYRGGGPNVAANVNIETVPVNTGSGGFSSPYTVIGGPTVTNSFVDQAPRPGVGKITFQRVPFDSLSGFVIAGYSNNYSDAVIVNGTVSNQFLLRTNATPDIVFTASDLGTTAAGTPFTFVVTGVGAWQNNAGINGVAGLAGPGIIQPAANGFIGIGFNKVGPSFINLNSPVFFQNEASAIRQFTWGSFDGSATPPVVYPNGASIQDLERQIFSP